MAPNAQPEPAPAPRYVVTRFVIVSLALLAASSLAWLAAPHARADGSITYEQRNYTVTIQHNGDVAISEHWQVHFSGGPYHHAFLQVYLARTAGIDFGAVTGANSGSQQVSAITDAAGNGLQQVSWDFPPAQDASRTFDIPYTLHAALGIGSSSAWFDWHFLDGGSSDHFGVTSSTIAISVPTATAASQLQVQATDSDTPPHTAVLSGTTVQASDTSLDASNPFEVMAVFPRGELAASVQRPPWQDSATPPALPTSLGLNSNPTANGQQPIYAPSTPSGNIFSGILAFCLGVPFLIFIALLAVSGAGHFYGARRGWWRAPYYGWWNGPGNDGRGPWNNGGGFGGGIGGGMGGGGGGGGGIGGGGGGGGGSGFS